MGCFEDGLMPYFIATYQNEEKGKTKYSLWGKSYNDAYRAFRKQFPTQHLFNLEFTYEDGLNLEGNEL